MPAVPINEEELQARAASVLREELPGAELGSITASPGWHLQRHLLGRLCARVSSLQGRAEGRPCGPHADQESRRPPPGLPPASPPGHGCSLPAGARSASWLSAGNSPLLHHAFRGWRVCGAELTSRIRSNTGGRSQEPRSSKPPGSLGLFIPMTLTLWVSRTSRRSLPTTSSSGGDPRSTACDEDLQVGHQEVRDLLAARNTRKGSIDLDPR